MLEADPALVLPEGSNQTTHYHLEFERLQSPSVVPWLRDDSTAAEAVQQAPAEAREEQVPADTAEELVVVGEGLAPVAQADHIEVADIAEEPAGTAERQRGAFLHPRPAEPLPLEELALGSVGHCLRRSH